MNQIRKAFYVSVCVLKYYMFTHFMSGKKSVEINHKIKYFYDAT